MPEGFQYREGLRKLREAVVEKRRILVSDFARARYNMGQEGNLLPESGAKYAEEMPAIQAQLAAIDAAIQDETALDPEE
ncbi:hypothetical protein FPV16_20680 [Methylobacterium sp. W2]|uniref:hypothetical protein n=1 Tax=Methylobacterium sp. W2 TaxID=2598107 RepID=UPI001D0C5928|nr:hypothetical protein [Methylobacterium sp. W2]MCC0808593.1 hypothetical protein [Methylobacterium sp. W2]